MTTSIDTYRIGVAGEDITPPVGIYLAGFAARTDPSTAVYHPLKANAIAIDDGSDPLLIVSAEILGFYEHTEHVRSRISAATGIAPSNVILSGSHTHCGPCIRDMDRHRHGDLDENYIEELFDRVTRLRDNRMGNPVACAPSFRDRELRYRRIPPEARREGRR